MRLPFFLIKGIPRRNRILGAFLGVVSRRMDDRWFKIKFVIISLL